LYFVIVPAATTNDKPPLNKANKKNKNLKQKIKYKNIKMYE